MGMAAVRMAILGGIPDAMFPGRRTLQMLVHGELFYGSLRRILQEAGPITWIDAGGTIAIAFTVAVTVAAHLSFALVHERGGCPHMLQRVL